MALNAVAPSAAFGDETDESASPSYAIEQLEVRVKLSELSLFRGLVLARALLPAIVLVVLLSVELEVGKLHPSVWIWAALAAWTCSTAPYLWTRLSWLRTLPLPARLEISVLVGLVFVGLGARSWHLLHGFVPLVFVAFFVSVRAAWIVAAWLIASLWGVYLVLDVWPAAPIESRLPALVPSAIIVATALLLVYVRRVLDDVSLIAAAQQRASEAIRAARHAVAAEIARIDVHERVAGELAVASRNLIGLVRREMAALRATASSEADLFSSCIVEIERTIAELGGQAQSQWEVIESTVQTEVDRAVAVTEALGKTVLVDGRSDTERLMGEEVFAFRRLITEVLANARKHGLGQVRVFVEAGNRSVVVRVENAGHVPVQEREGGLGLQAMRSDASLLGATLTWELTSTNIVLVTAMLPVQAVRPSGSVSAENSGSSDLAQTVSGRQTAYEKGVLVTRLLFAILAVITVQTGASEHRSLLPALTVSSILLVTWNAGLLLRYRSLSTLLARRPGLVWLDALAIVALITFEAGIASPWMPLSMGCLLAVGLWRGAWATLSLAGMLSGAMLVGWGLMHALPLDDAGTRQQDMPLAWLLNTSVYLAVAGVAIGIGWLFRRVDEAVIAYQETLDLQRQAERDAANAEARAETRRELHASLQQYVGAALLRLGLIRRLTANPAALDASEMRLLDLRDAVRRVIAELET